MLLSSPPRRGCFSGSIELPTTLRVFPASAGVFLGGLDALAAAISLPRLGGGVSRVGRMGRRQGTSSPPRRGCFQKSRTQINEAAVFPASAGVFPASKCCKAMTPCLPRLGGGVSLRATPMRGGFRSSPPRRGCFPSVQMPDVH